MQLNKSWFVIVNPIAGFGKGLKKWKALKPLLEKEFNVVSVFTEYDRHAIDLTKKALEDGWRQIIAIGGDGTLHQVINGLMTQNKIPTHEVVVAFISCGTGNDWVRSYLFPTKNEALVSLIKKKKTVFQDIGVVTHYWHGKPTTEYFNNLAGVGFDAYVIQQTKNKVGGQFAYLLGMVRCLFTYRCIHLKLKINGQQYESMSYLTLAAINQFAGGGMKLAPQAINNDGLFDVILVRAMSKWDVLKYMHKLFDGSYILLPQVSVFRASSFEVEILTDHSNTFCEADGELIGGGPFSFKVIHNGLQIVVPS